MAGLVHGDVVAGRAGGTGGSGDAISAIAVVLGDVALGAVLGIDRSVKGAAGDLNDIVKGAKLGGLEVTVGNGDLARAAGAALSLTKQGARAAEITTGDRQ